MLNKLFDGSFMPHGHCLLWRWDLLFLHVTGDLLTFTAYFIIPLVLIYLVDYCHRTVEIDPQNIATA